MSNTRRFFLGSLAGMAGAGAPAGQQRGAASFSRNRVSPLDGVTREKIRITDIKLTNLAYRLTPEEQWPDADNNVIIWKTESVIVEVSTDADITGIGGCRGYNGPQEMKQYAESVLNTPPA